MRLTTINHIGDSGIRHVVCQFMVVNPMWFTTPRVGLEPTGSNQQSAENKELTEKANPVFATGLAKTLQKYPELKQIITAWPELPEHTKTAIKSLIQTHKKESK